MLTQTDTYKEFVFPAGTIFFANTWAIHHNEDEYDDPSPFRPERWLGGNKHETKASIQLGAGETRKTSYGWGAGRRTPNLLWTNSGRGLDQDQQCKYRVGF
ncbi:hypothetical protein BDW74DRAFT_158909 [Aspergillus multicolor]|uniref:uncharacterized protein n=1 Tax=Aspergillus multicolor TaxID=41759 RepID=UPI003CCD9251